MSRGLSLLFIIGLAFNVSAEEQCQYTAADGRIVAGVKRESIPEGYRRSARCFQVEHLAAPKEVELDGNIRRERAVTALGVMAVRWPRSVERLFGRTPMRALSEAGNVVRRALANTSFPSEVRQLSRDWDVVFLDETIPETQIPFHLISNCHPAWMTPPANLYIVGQRVVAGCGEDAEEEGAGVSDAKLLQILLHEIGHVIEAELLAKSFGNDRGRAEGFATWFEGYAANFTSLVSRGAVRAQHEKWARQGLKSGLRLSGPFQGSPLDYALWSMPFRFVEQKRGIGGIANLYQRLAKAPQPLLPTVAAELGLSAVQAEKGIVEFVE